MKSVIVRPAYSVAEFTEEFGIGRTRAFEEIAAGRLKAFKVGARTLIAGEDALAWRDAYRESNATLGNDVPGRENTRRARR